MFDMIDWGRVEYLYALTAVPLLIVLYVLGSALRRRRLRRLGDAPLVRDLQLGVSPARRRVKILLLAAGLFFLVFALARPRIGTALRELKREGVDIIIALDVSNSMLAEDIVPNRLARSKGAISRLIDQLRNDRIGIVAFAGDAFILLPLTSDYAAAKLFVSTMDTKIVSTQGTAVGAAVGLAREAFESEETKYKVLVVITDGENHDEEALEEAAKASAEGVVIHTIGMGSADGVPIPRFVNGVRAGFHTDRQGNVVVSRLNETFLRQLAGAANGTYIRATSSDAGLQTILEQIDSMEKKEFDRREFSDYDERFQIFLGIAFALLLLDAVLAPRMRDRKTQKDIQHVD